MRYYEFYNLSTGEVARARFHRIAYALAWGKAKGHNTMIQLKANGWTGPHWWNVQTGERRRRVVHPINWKTEPASPFMVSASPALESPRR